MKENKPKGKKGLNIALIITLCLFILSFLTFLYFYTFKGQLQSLKEFSVSGISPTLAEELTRNIVYKTDQLSESLYFSDSLQATMKVNQEVLSVSESPGRVHFSSKGDLLFQFSSAQLRLIEEDVKEYAQENLYYDDLTLVSEKEEGEVGYLLYSYSLSSSIIDSLPTTSEEPVDRKGYITVMYRDLDNDQTAYLEIVGLNYEQEKPVNNEFLNIIQTLSFDIENIDQEITAEMGSGDVTLSYDRSSWDLINLSDYSISLNDKVNNDNTVLVTSFDAIGYTDDEAQEYLLKQAEDELIETKTYQETTENVLEQIGEPEIVEINNQEFARISYDITYKNGQTTREIYYYGILEQKEKLITISIKSDNYNEESIALIDSVLENIELHDQVINSQVLGSASVSINPTTVLGQASTVKIYVSKCVDLQFTNTLQDWNVNGNSYKICSEGTGSGFVIDNQGHIVTNAHVANPNNLDLLFSGGSTDGRFEEDMYNDVLNMLASQYGPMVYSLSNEQIYATIVEVLYAMYSESLFTMTPNTPTLYVQGDQPFMLSRYVYDLENSTAHYSASLIDNNDITSSMESSFNPDVKMADVADLALIKIDGNFSPPSIPIRPRGVVTGQDIFVVGYPGIAESSQMANLTIPASSTVTKGTISAIRPNSNDTFEILQIDASIAGGNSGGPIISDDGYVVGVATYGMTGATSGNYNIGVKADSVENFLASTGVTPLVNDQREVLEEALLDISKSYYSSASDKFLALITEEPSLYTTLNPFIELCDVKIQAGEDKTPPISEEAIVAFTVILSAILLCLTAIFIVLLISRRKKDKKEEVTGANLPREDLS